MMDYLPLISPLVNILSIAVGGLYALAKLDARFQVLANAHESFVDRLNKMDLRLEVLNETLVALAKQEERMNAQDRRIQELASRLDNRFEDMMRAINNRPAPRRKT